MIKDHEKFIIINHHDLKTVSVALMNYQEFSSYAQHMINMILCSHKFFVCCYINNIIKETDCCSTRSIIFRNSQKSQDLLRSNRMTLLIYFLLCSTNQITTEQKNCSTTQKFYNQTDKKKLLKENINF